MEKEQKLKEIRKVIIKANPEIVELKFGCEVELQRGIISRNSEWLDSGEGTAKQTVLLDKRFQWNCIIGTKGRKKEVCVKEWFSCDLYHLNRITEIIGRPIHLADVLLVMKGIENRDFSSQIHLINGNVEHCRWKLKNDNLENQSPETIDFLYSLLK